MEVFAVRKTSITIVIMIMTIMLSGCGKNKSEKINEKELEIEQKYGIEIEKVREEDLKVISEYFAKLPDGFVEELKTYQDYEEYQDRKIYIYVSGDGVTDVKNDVSRGDYWILDNNKEIEDQLAYCTMESVSYNISYRKKGTNLLHAWNRYNPSIYDYSDDKEYFKYLYNEDNTEEAYFIGEEPVLYAMDDEARIFALLMTEDEKGFEILDKAPNIRKKAFYIRNMMDYAFETVDETAYWNRYFTETIEIEGADNDTLKIIDEYFANLPKGFVKELKKYEGIDDRKLHIEIGNKTSFYSDIGKGDTWNIKKMTTLREHLGTLRDIPYAIT